MRNAVLFMTFNRFDYTRQVFAAIAQARPPRLYLASDGPREGVEGEAERVAEIRTWLLDNVTWPCEVRTLFREKNLGLGFALSGAVTWFFQQEESGIILEDDTLPNQSFFRYCGEMLEYHRENKQVWCVSGFDLFQIYGRDYAFGDASYDFVNYMVCWGWAGWADRWLPQYDLNLQTYDRRIITALPYRDDIKKFLLDILDVISRNPAYSYAFPIIFALLKYDGLCAIPRRNMVMNIGEQGKNHNGVNLFHNTPCHEIDQIQHPDQIQQNYFLSERLFSDTWINKSVAPSPVHRLTKRYKLLNAIPVWKICEVGNDRRHYLFNRIPVLKTTIV